MATALVVCIGNDLVADDGVGHAVYHVLASRLPADTNLKLLGLGGMSLLEEFQGEKHLIVVDAVQLGAPPGTIHVMDWSMIPSGGSHVSCHGIGIREAMAVSQKLYPEATPRTVHLIGVEGRCFDKLGEGLSREVAAAVEPAAAAVLELLAKT
jgi:hydrogenase maturation protease